MSSTYTSGASFAPDTANPSAAPKAPRLVRLSVDADICPQVLMRVLGLIAQRSFVPLTITVNRRHDGQTIAIEIDDLGSEAAMVLLAKVEAIVAVRSAEFVVLR